MIANLKKNKKKGFTLVELIVVIAIIAIIAAVAVPTTISYVNKAKVSTALNEATELGNNMQTAFTDFALSNEKISATSLASLLNTNMPDVVHVTSIAFTYTAGAENILKAVIFTDATSDEYDDDEDLDGTVGVVKTYNLSALGLSVDADFASVTLYADADAETVWSTTAPQA